MTTKQREDQLELHLKDKLVALERLAEQIRSTGDFSENAEMILCLRELVLEQMSSHSDGGRDENPSHTNY